MKKIVIIIICFIWIGIPSVWAEEKITAFDVTLDIAQDATVSVVEHIVYDFDDAQKHGIYRTIPYKYNARGGNFSVRFDDIAVMDEQGVPMEHKVTRENGEVKIRIGDADTYVSGVKEYVIHYTAQRVINYFDAHDELYWNVTGNGWNVPIDRVNVQVHTPATIIKQECFAGSYGASTACMENTMGQAAQKNLYAYEGVTVVVGMEKGVIAKPSWLQQFLWFVRDNMIFVVPIFVGFFMLRTWYVYGRDPRGQGTIVPQWEIPESLAPMQIGIIIDEKAHKRDLSSVFIDLAIRGYFKIRKEEKKGLLSKEDYVLIKTTPQKDDKLRPFEKKIMRGLFDTDVQKEVKLSSLKNAFYTDADAAISAAYEGVTQQGYFLKNPKTVRGTYFGIGIAIVFMSIWGGGMLSYFVSPLTIAIGAVSGIVIIAFAAAMPRRTRKGVIAREQSLGLKQYLQTAEKRRIDFHNAPEKNPETFEKYLPYAIVLGVETAWAQQFDDIYKGHNPSWYDGGSDFSATSLTRATSGFASVAHATAVSKPSSSSSGSSGFSGGGSGGGFGGGGGGSW